MNGNDFVDSVKEEKLESMRSKACIMLRAIQDCYKALRICRDADGQAGQVPVQGSEWERLVSDPGFQEIVRFWGFDSVQQLFSMPAERRIEYFGHAIAFVESIFGQDAEGLQRILDDLDRIVVIRELRLFQLKAEDIEREVSAAFAGIARKMSMT